MFSSSAIEQVALRRSPFYSRISEKVKPQKPTAIHVKNDVYKFHTPTILICQKAEFILLSPGQCGDRPLPISYRFKH